MVGNPPNANLMAELSVKWGKKCIGCPPTFSSCHSNPWFIPHVLKTDSRRLFWTVCSAATDERVSTVTLKTAVSYMPALSNLPYFAGLGNCHCAISAGRYPENNSALYTIQNGHCNDLGKKSASVYQ